MTTAAPGGASVGTGMRAPASTAHDVITVDSLGSAYLEAPGSTPQYTSA